MQQCKRCVMDTTDPYIKFDSNGICNHCKEAEKILKTISMKQNEKELNNLINEIKEAGKDKDYDCIIGLSGGVDSTYVALKVKEFGLRPLGVHFDNGWNSSFGEDNIDKSISILGVPCERYKVNEAEFFDIQLSFLKASVPDCEIPTDHALVSYLYDMANKHKIKYILAGTNRATESIMPTVWSQGHRDWKYIRGIQKQFGKEKIKTIPHKSYFDMFVDMNIRNIKWISILDYMEYDKEKALTELEDKVDYYRFKQKHSESVFTRFYQGYILPEKFNYDKRKAHLSSLIISGQITKADAIIELDKSIYEEGEFASDKAEILEKLKLTDKEFKQIMTLPLKGFSDYPSYSNSGTWKMLKSVYKGLNLKKI